MTRNELRDAVEKPAEKLKVRLQPGLTDRILDDVGDEPGRLPLLEFALTLLWDRQAGGWMTHEAYEAIGGVEEALARHAEDVYRSLSEDDERQVQRILTQLVRPGEGTIDTRRRATRSERGDRTGRGDGGRDRRGRA
jgi:hypothetical protein